MTLLVSPSRDVILDMATGEACSRGRAARLGLHEAGLLGYMIEMRGAPCSVHHLAYAVCWPEGWSMEPDTIRSNIAHIRQKLGYETIRTMRTAGYQVP